MKRKIYIYLGIAIALLLHNSALSGQTRLVNLSKGLLNEQSKLTTQISLTENGDQGIEMLIKINQIAISETLVEQKAFQLINMEGFSHLTETGYPALPAKTITLALPLNLDFDITIAESEFIELDNLTIHPALAPATDTKGDAEPVFELNEKCYNTNAFYPETIVNKYEIQYLKGVPIAFIRINPVQFNPVTKKVRIYKNLNIKISFNSELSDYKYLETQLSQEALDIIKRSVVNPSLIPSKSLQSTLNNTPNYLIITHVQYLETAKKLADWKMQLGYNTEILFSSQWTSDEIKTAIATRYQNYTLKPDYFVIIGDHYGSYPVPAQELYTSENELYVTDLYYACMDGTNDFVPDMAHGRISVNSVEEAEIVINKIINYEKYPVNNASFYQNGLNCAQYQDDDNNGYADRRFTHTSEDVRDYMIAQGYNVERIYYTETQANIANLHYNSGYYSTGALLPDELRSLSFNWDGGESDITNAINAGKFYVLHRDHGYTGGSGWANPYYVTGSIDDLSNGNLLPVVFSINCYTGAFSENVCFAEKFLRANNKGAVGVFGASCASYSGYNDALVSGLFDAIFPTPGLKFTFGSGGYNYPPLFGAPAIKTLGNVLNLGLIRMVDAWNGSTSGNRYQHELFHYFGDPAMKIWTSNPYDSTLSLLFGDTVMCDSTKFHFYGYDGDSLLATFMQSSQIVGKGYIANDTASINIALINFDTLTLTLSRENHLPYITQIAVKGTCAFAPTVATDSISNVSYNSVIAHGNILSDNGNTVSESGFVCSENLNPQIGNEDVIVIYTNPVVTLGAFNATINGLLGNTIYYYRAFAINGIDTSYGESKLFKTLCDPEGVFPYIYDFEVNDLPECWGQEYVSGNNIDWQFDAGTINPSVSAYSGNKNALFTDNTGSEDRTKLISNQFDFSGYSYASLAFYHIQKPVYSFQDELRIYYKNSKDGEWQMIDEFTTNTNDWTLRELLLPELSNEYFIAFEGNGKLGDGVGVDLMSVSTTANQPEIVIHSVANIEFGDVGTGTTSDIQSYTISATNLISNLTIQAPQGFSISLDTNDGFYQSIEISPVNYIIDTTVIYVQFFPEIMQNYEGEISNMAIAASTQTISVSGNGISSINEFNSEVAIEIFPNPFEHSVTIVNKSLVNIEKIELLNLEGVVLKTTITGLSNNERIQIQSVEANKGIYFLKIYTNEGISIKKLIKQ